MVFRSDPRAGYFKIDFNIEWFYQYLDERGEELVITPTRFCSGYEYSEDELARRQLTLEKYIERAVEYWMAYKVFGNTSKRIILYTEIDMSDYESVYDLMYAIMIEFIQQNPDYFTLREVE